MRGIFFILIAILIIQTSSFSQWKSFEDIGEWGYGDGDIRTSTINMNTIKNLNSDISTRQKLNKTEKEILSQNGSIALKGYLLVYKYKVNPDDLIFVNFKDKKTRKYFTQALLYRGKIIDDTIYNSLKEYQNIMKAKYKKDLIVGFKISWKAYELYYIKKKI